MFQYPVLWNSKRNWYFWIRLIEIVKYISYMAWYFSDKWWRFQGWRRLRWRRRHLFTTILDYPILNAFDTVHFLSRSSADAGVQTADFVRALVRFSNSKILKISSPSTSAEHCNSFQWVIFSAKTRWHIQCMKSVLLIGRSLNQFIESNWPIQIADCSLAPIALFISNIFSE